MIDTRSLQRTLFRMQLDPNFAARVFDRDAEALASTDLSPRDLELVFEADPIAIRADPGGRRLSQLLGNVIGEFTIVVNLAVERLGISDVVIGFASSPEFHEAIRFNHSLPIAFSSYIDRRLTEFDDGVVQSIAKFEGTLAVARRELRKCNALAERQISLAPEAHLLELTQGTFELHKSLASSPQGIEPAKLALGSGSEVLLLTSKPAQRSGGLFSVDVEVLSDMVAAVLRAAESSLDWEGQNALAEECGVEASELRGFLASLIDDGVLESGPNGLPGT